MYIYVYISTGVNSYWCCAAYPNDGGLLGVGILLVNVDALLQVEQQRHAGHEAEHDVQAEIERVHLCSDTQKQTAFGSQIGSRELVVSDMWPGEPECQSIEGTGGD